MKTFSKMSALKLFRFIFGTCLMIFFGTTGGYAMGPPPPPLNLSQFQTLVAQADLIAVGKIDRAQKTTTTIEAVLIIEESLKGRMDGKSLTIKENQDPLTTETHEVISKQDGSKQTISAERAGPMAYHGKYQQGMRVVVLLENIKGTNQYRPLGSGTYNKYLCEFIIENNRIETRYFRFADDMAKYTGSEKEFISIIKKIIKPDTNKSFLNVLFGWL